MNMKKTIAALAAGAVAVSAMATTVSALADTTLTYNLVKKHEIKRYDNHKATYEFTVNDASADTATVEFYSPIDAVKSVVVKVASSEAGEQNKIFTYSTDVNALNYNAKLVAGNATTPTVLTFQDELTGYEGALTLTITVNSEIDAKATGDKYDEVKEINAIIDTANAIVDCTKVAATADEAATGVTPVTLKAFTKGGEKTITNYAPLETNIKDNVNITYYLQNDIGYHNVGAVLNDAIENYETVTFTFNTATQGIVWTVLNESTGEKYFDKVYGKNGAWVEEYNGMAKGGTYEEALKAASRETWTYTGDNNMKADLLGLYCDGWYADTSYLSFDQHLYQGTLNPFGSYKTSYGSEATGYTGFDWTGYNLFQGALVINENLTMSLAETDYFDWTATSLSFDWDAIMDGAMTSNDYAVYLHSMKLATSNTWYWDNMTVTLTAGAADDVEAEAGVEADDEELAEEEVEEEVVEEEVEEEEVEVEVANPTTGNASVALAVIPVALAAAAVVAKKRS